MLAITIFVSQTQMSQGRSDSRIIYDPAILSVWVSIWTVYVVLQIPTCTLLDADNICVG